MGDIHTIGVVQSAEAKVTMKITKLLQKLGLYIKTGKTGVSSRPKHVNLDLYIQAYKCGHCGATNIVLFLVRLISY